MKPTVLITGAAGNVGAKLAAHLRSRAYPLRLTDVSPSGDPAIVQADLSEPGPWQSVFKDVDVVVHLAANPSAQAGWDDLVGPNLDAVLNVYAAACAHGVKKVVLASSVWAMAARHCDEGPIVVEAAQPGGVPYGVAKAFAERVAGVYARRGLPTIAIRLGGCRLGDNPPTVVHDRWEDQCWISNRDTVDGFERAILADVDGLAIVNLTSRIPRGRWSLAEAERLLGYRPQDTRPPLKRPSLLDLFRG